MEENSLQDNLHRVADKDHRKNSSQSRGIRKRKWGSWVAEIRMPRSRQKLWLGSYTTADQAAHAYDAAAYCLRGSNAIFNFPDSVPSIPSASSLSRPQIQLAAARYATMDRPPSVSPSEHNNNHNGNASDNYKAREQSASSSQSPSVQETVSLGDGHHQRKDESASWDGVSEVSDVYKNLERWPSIDENSAMNLIPIPSPGSTWEEQHHEQEEKDNYFLHLTDLWKF